MQRWDILPSVFTFSLLIPVHLGKQQKQKRSLSSDSSPSYSPVCLFPCGPSHSLICPFPCLVILCAMRQLQCS